jgi:hypothetical protein
MLRHATLLTVLIGGFSLAALPVAAGRPKCHTRKPQKLWAACVPALRAH